MPLDFAVSAFVTLFLVVDPIGLAPSFLAITHGLPETARRQVGLRACINAALILAGSALFGAWLLTRLGISLSAFRIAGGLLLFSIASEMVFGVRTERQSRAAEQAIEGARSQHRRLSARDPADGGTRRYHRNRAALRPRWRQCRADRIAARHYCRSLRNRLAVYLIAATIERGLGDTGHIVVARLLGVILAALAVQYVADGDKGDREGHVTTT